MNLADEMLDHLFRAVEVGNDAVAHRADRLDAAGCAAQHQLGIFAHRQYLFLAILHVIRHHRRLVQNDPLAADIDQRVRGAEVDRHIRREDAGE